MKTAIPVMVVMHSMEDAKGLSEILPSPPWRVVPAPSLDWAKEQLTAGAEFPLILCEDDCGSGTWKDLLHLVTSARNPPELVLASRHTDHDSWQEAFSFGAFDVLARPFDAHELQRVLSLAWLRWQSRNDSLKAVPSSGAGKMAVGHAGHSPAQEKPERDRNALVSQHELQRRLADRFETALLEGRSMAVLSDLFDQLCAFVVLHHTTQETIMSESQSLEMNTQRAEHDRMRQRVFRLERAFREGDRSAADEVLRMIRNSRPESPAVEQNTARKRLLLADDHKLVLEGLQRILEPEFQVAGTVQDGRALLAAASELHPDVILADISMPLLNGIDAARQLKKTVPETRVIFVTMHADRAYVLAAVEVGAAGYVPKHSTPQQLLLAVRSVLDGQRYLAPGVSLEAEHLWNTPERPSQRTLTARQREVLQLIGEGKSNKAIAAVLHISVKAVEFHKTSINRTLGTAKHADLTRYAVEHGLVAP